MDRETIIRIVVTGVLVVAIMYATPWAMHRFWPGRPAAAPSAPSGPAATGPASPSPPAAPVTPGAPGAEPPSVRAPVLVASGAAEGQTKTVRLGSASCGGQYDLEAEIDPVGAAVSRLTLARHRFFRTVEDRHLPPEQRAAMDLVEPGGPARTFTLPEVRVRLKGVEEWVKADLSGVAWRVEPSADLSSATCSAELRDGQGQTVLTVRKTLTLFPRPAAEGGGDAPPQYEMRLRLEFSAAEAVEKIGYVLDGPPALPAGAGAYGSRGPTQMVVAGAWSDGRVHVVHATGRDLKKPEGAAADAPAVRHMAGPDLAWCGQADRYFAVIMIPQEPSARGTFAAGAEAVAIGPAVGKEPPKAGVRIVSKEFSPRVGRPEVHELAVYAGPKDYKHLEKYYANLALPDLIQWASCCVPIPGLQTIARFLVVVLDAFYSVTRNYGLAIILLVVVLRAALFPVSRWSARSMAEMQKLGPKMQQIREQFADDPKRMQEEMAKIGGFKAFGGCLPMFIQMPIWIGLYGSLAAAIQLRHAALLPSAWVPEGSLFLQDLSAPDSLIHWKTPWFVPGQDIPLLGWLLGGLHGMLAGGPGGITSFNLLPVLMAVAMYLQQKMTPQPAAASPQAEQQRRMMSFMTVFFGLILYSAPSGLCLYIVTSTLLGFVEQRYLKRKLAEEQPAATDALKAAPPTSSPPVKPRPLVGGRQKSLGERVEAWLKQRMTPPKDNGRAETKDRKRRQGK